MGRRTIQAIEQVYSWFQPKSKTVKRLGGTAFIGTGLVGAGTAMFGGSFHIAEAFADATANTTSHTEAIVRAVAGGAAVLTGAIVGTTGVAMGVNIITSPQQAPSGPQ